MHLALTLLLFSFKASIFGAVAVEAARGLQGGASGRGKCDSDAPRVECEREKPCGGWFGQKAQRVRSNVGGGGGGDHDSWD